MPIHQGIWKIGEKSQPIKSVFFTVLEVLILGTKNTLCAPKATKLDDAMKRLKEIWEIGT